MFLKQGPLNVKLSRTYTVKKAKMTSLMPPSSTPNTSTNVDDTCFFATIYSGKFEYSRMFFINHCLDSLVCEQLKMTGIYR